jgi:hypothetical protein
MRVGMRNGGDGGRVGVLMGVGMRVLNGAVAMRMHVEIAAMPTNQ